MGDQSTGYERINAASTQEKLTGSTTTTSVTRGALAASHGRNWAVSSGSPLLHMVVLTPLTTLLYCGAPMILRVSPSSENINATPRLK